MASPGRASGLRSTGERQAGVDAHDAALTALATAMHIAATADDHPPAD